MVVEHLEAMVLNLHFKCNNILRLVYHKPQLLDMAKTIQGINS